MRARTHVCGALTKWSEMVGGGGGGVEPPTRLDSTLSTVHSEAPVLTFCHYCENANGARVQSGLCCCARDRLQIISSVGKQLCGKKKIEMKGSGSLKHVVR